MGSSLKTAMDELRLAREARDLSYKTSPVSRKTMLWVMGLISDNLTATSAEYPNEDVDDEDVDDEDTQNAPYASTLGQGDIDAITKGFAAATLAQTIRGS